MDTATHAAPDAILARFRASGAPKDLGELFDVTSGDLYRVALATAPDAAAAEDAVQETYLAVIGAVARWDPSRRAMPWLLGILHFKVTRQREKFRRPDTGELRPEKVAPEITDGDPERAAIAWAEIERLEEPYRAVALMRWRYGLSPAEIAHVRGEAPGTTRSLLSRALDRVRKTLKVLPAGLVLLGRPARGLNAVRAEVVSAAAGPTTIAVAGTSIGVRWLVAAVLVAAVGTTVFFALRPDAPPPATPVAETPAPTADTTTLAVPVGRGLAVDAPAVRAAGPRAHGRVIDETGKPIASAAISSTATDAYAFERPAGLESDLPTIPASSRTAQTDSDGRFDVALSDDQPTHLIFVSAPGHGPVIVGPARPGAALEVVLGKGETWQGRVRDAAGGPIAGARIRACVVMPWFAFVRETTTDGTGSFRLEAMPDAERSLPRGRLATAAWIVATADGFAPAVAGGKGGPIEHQGETTITLLRGASLVGRLTDADSGTPIAGAVVRLALMEMVHGWSSGLLRSNRLHADCPFGPFPLTTAVTDADGKYRLEHLPCLSGARPAPVEEAADRRPWAGRLTATVEGFALSSLLVRQIEDGGTDVRDVKLTRAATARGRLVDEAGKPIGSVVGIIELGAPAPWAQSFVTDADGRYSLEGIPAPAAGAAARIRVPGETQPSDASILLRGGVATDVADVVVSFARPTDQVEHRVRVVDATGRPIWGAEVQVVATGASASTDRDGRAVVSSVAVHWSPTSPGVATPENDSTDIAVWAAGYADETVRRAKDAAATEEIVVQLEPGRRIAGIVRLANGRPADGAVVRADRSKPGAKPTSIASLPVAVTDSRGAFTFEGLADDVFALSAKARSESHSESAPTVRVESVRSGTADLVIQLPPDTRPPQGQLEVIIIDDATSLPLAGGYVRLRRGEKETIWAQAMTAGRHVAREIPPGNWNVRAFVDGYTLEIVRDVAIDATPRSVPLEVRLKRPR